MQDLSQASRFTSLLSTLISLQQPPQQFSATEFGWVIPDLSALFAQTSLEIIQLHVNAI